MANIYDIAREANVSRSTVSRVINDQPSVSEAKRERVLAAIDKLKYTPSATARALALNKTNTIGVVTRELAQSFYGEFIEHIHYKADQLNYGVLYAMRNNFLSTKIDYRTLLHKKVDGYLYLGEGTASKEDIEALLHNDIPVIGYEFEYDIEKALFININNYESSYNAIKYLYELNHKKVIHITFNVGLQEMSQRKQGYLDAVKDFNILDSKVIGTTFDEHEIYKCCSDLVPYIKDNDISAAFCGNNKIASLLVEVLIQSGIKVPEEFSVIGFDDTPVERPLYLKRHEIPEISSIKQPQQEMADYGIKALIKSIEKSEPLEAGNHIFDCTMNIRETTMYYNK